MLLYKINSTPEMTIFNTLSRRGENEVAVGEIGGQRRLLKKTNYKERCEGVRQK